MRLQSTYLPPEEAARRRLARSGRDAPIDGIDHGEISEGDELLFVSAAYLLAGVRLYSARR